MKLVDNWKQAWRWLSVHALAAVAAAPFAWAGLPDDVKAMVPEGWGLWIFLLIGIGGIAGRLVSQSGDQK